VAGRWTASTGLASRSISSPRSAPAWSKTIGNHLTFLHGLWSFGVKREWVGRNVVALVDRPRQLRFKERRIRFLSLA
jgi:hypothetical protein